MGWEPVLSYLWPHLHVGPNILAPIYTSVYADKSGRVQYIFLKRPLGTDSMESLNCKCSHSAAEA